MAHSGMPSGWNERYKSGLGIDLPTGVEFFVTPGHGFLRVDLRLHTAMLSSYDYHDGPNHVLLEEDCSMPLWLVEHGLMPNEIWIDNMAMALTRQPA